MITKSQSHRLNSGLRGGERGSVSEQKGDRSERWTSSRLLPDSQGSDCSSVSGPLSSVCARVCGCACALAQSLMTGKQFIPPPPSLHSDQCLSTPGLDSFLLMYNWRSITVRWLLTGLVWPTHSFAKLHWTALGSPESYQRGSTVLIRVNPKVFLHPHIWISTIDFTYYGAFYKV